MRGLKVGVVRELAGEGYAPGVEQRFHEAVELLAGLGAEVVEVSCPTFAYALPAYYLILPSEASSNLAKFDAMRFGLRVGRRRHPERRGGHGADARGRASVRRSSAGSSSARTRCPAATTTPTTARRRRSARSSRGTSSAAFASVDVLVSPSTPGTAFKIGEKVDDPLAMYLDDLCTIPSNLAGNASASFPVGLAPEDGLPVGLQVMAPPLADDRLYRVGAALERALEERWGGPLLAQVPELPRAQRAPMTEVVK